MHRSFYCLCLLFACGRSQNVKKIENLMANFSHDEEQLWQVNDYPEVSKVLEFYEIYMDVDFGEIGIFQMISKEWLNDEDVFEFIKHIATVNSTFSQAFTLIKAKNYADILKFANDLDKEMFQYNSLLFFRQQRMYFWSLVQNTSRICDNRTKYILAESQVEREVYKEILAHFLKAYMILEFTSSMQRNTIYVVRERTTLRMAVQEFKDMVYSYEHYVGYKEIKKKLSREMWACDPNDFKLSEKTDSFLEVSMPYQGFISNEMNLNSNRKCRQSCSDYTNTRQFVCDENLSCPGKESVRKELVCHGSVQNCVTMHDDMTVCVAPSNSSRRYDFIKFDDGKVFGVEKKCSNKLHLVSHWDWFHKCDNCLCYCNEEDNTSNVGSHFSLRDVTSDIDHNLVVTGVGLTTVNGVIQLTILQQRLLPNGVLNTTKDQKNSNWITSTPLNISDDETLVENRDYVSVTWQNRSIALTSVTIDDNDHLVTGVRFHKQAGGHINVEIRATRYDFQRGMLIDVADSFWMGNEYLLKELKLDSPDVPTKSTEKSQMFVENNEFIKFQPSDIEKDGAQTTVPYLDTSTVRAYIPLSGIGLYYKSTPGYGGFIAPKLITFDFGSITIY